MSSLFGANLWVVPAYLRAFFFELPSGFFDRGAAVRKADEKLTNPRKAFNGVARKGVPRHRF
jgi:hypothetical protein